MLLRPDLIGTNRELIRSPGIPTLSPSDLKRFLCWGSHMPESAIALSLGFAARGISSGSVFP